MKISLEGVSRARQLSHPFTLVCSLNHCAELCHLRREPESAKEMLEELMSICSDRGFALYAAWGTLLIGHELAAQKRVEEGIAQIQRGLADWKATGAGLSLPGYLANLAEAYANAGKWEEGLSCIEQAFVIQAETGEFLYDAELHRLQGELFLAQGGREGEAEACFQQALYRARSQNARSWELRAGLSLGRLWSRQGKRSQVQGLLSGILSGFTEGFDTPDMREARLLCEG